MAEELNEVNPGHTSRTLNVEHALQCCKPSYQIRKLKNKGAIMILIWNFLVVSVFNYLKVFVQIPGGASIVTITMGFTLPLAGWLADVYLGWYKMIRWSMWVMWIASMLATLSSVVAQLVDSYYYINKTVSFVMFFIMATGFGGYQANIVQFGLDQLQDASTTEITAFIRWYVWTFLSSRAIFQFSLSCLKDEYHIIGLVLVSISLTIVISSSFMLNSCLVKEPVTQNPFKQIYKVIKYAINNKHPRCRSAFTYCEDELPSRIDFGKSKYGGPFTTEQVEDVKTFLRLLIVLAIASALTGQILIIHKPMKQLIQIFLNTQSSTIPMRECYRENFFTTTIGYFAAAILIPLYEFFIYPTLQKSFPSIKTLQKIALGMTLQIANIIILIAFDLTARKTFYEHHDQETVQCIFSHDQGALSSSFNSNWMAIVQLIDIISVTMLTISSIDFVISQTPYSMRGLMVGAGYGSVLLFTMIGYGIYWPFTHHSSTWGTGIISCEFWYLLSVLVVLIIASGILLAVGRWYKNRKRQDVLPNEHIFAERYYARVN